MSEHYDFHYQPTGSGAISGQQVLEQTEDAINELGDYVNDNVGGAMDVAQQALETAQNAEQDAQTALDTANSFSDAIQSAQQDASTALSTAQTAQTTASNANNTAIQASQDASSAVTTANNASGQVSTLSGTVTALGQRVTTAEGNIGQNTSDITALTTRVGTAEGNITTLQNDVSIAQGNASSAMATAGQVKQQAFVFRYSSTALTASSTNSNALLDNTDNLKVGDKVIDSNGVLFSITAIDTQNSTFTIGTALIDLAQDSDVVHKSGNETVGGSKTFLNSPIIYNPDTSVNNYLVLKNSKVTIGSTAETGSQRVVFQDKNGTPLSSLISSVDSNGWTYTVLEGSSLDSQSNIITRSVRLRVTNTDASLLPSNNNNLLIGSASARWSGVYATNYYYGNDNVEFSTKFATTDTNQTISGNKTFEGVDLKLKSVAGEYTVSSGSTSLLFYDKNSLLLSQYKQGVFGSGISYQNFSILGYDSNNQQLIKSITFSSSNLNLSTAYLRPDTDNAISLGRNNNRWSDVQTYKVNNLEPSSLSLPSGNVSDVIDISSYITDLSGNVNSYTVPANGWISIAVTGTAISIVSSSWSDSRLRESSGNVRMLYPVLKNETLDISVIGTTLDYARFIPCQGNV